jgi:sarcosine oxidase subunit alpha
MNRFASGGLIDRAQPLSFRFDGNAYTGLAGDTLASALLANGVRLAGRSFKYHRPRGILSAGPEEPNALVELRRGARREPNIPATTVELFSGLEADSQNRWPSLRFDAMAVTGLLAPLFPAGFYYKTFMWPARFWERLYEPAIRRAAGLGRAAEAEDPDRYDRAHLYCDVLVIGGGAAGLAAALAAGRRGARVVLCESDWRLGGRLLADGGEIDGLPAADWAVAAEAELRAMPEVRLMPRTTVFGAYDHGTYGAVQRVADHEPEPGANEPRQRYWRITAERCVLAAGAIERLVAFSGNDRPGVMLSGAVRQYLNRYAVAPGRRAIVVTAGDDGWRTVTELASHGIEVAAVVDRRAEMPERHAAAAASAGARVYAGGRIGGTLGGSSLFAADIVEASGERTRVAADLLAVAGGWNPTVQLTCHLGGKPVWSSAAEAFVPGALPPGMAVVGAARGSFGLGSALAEGARAGAEAAEGTGFSGSAPAIPFALDADGAPAPIWIDSGARKAFVDLQHDVTLEDIAIAHREGFRAVELLKRYTTHGMATDQGKTGGVLGMAAMAGLTGMDMAETGTTVFRPPYTPVAIGALAGPHRGQDYRPRRRTPAQGWAEEQGAVMTEVGLWHRALWFPRPGEADWQAIITREIGAIRTGAGVAEVSTLGKIELVGPDAGALLDFLYINTFSTLPVGRTRFGIMLREDGFAMDDGTTARLEQERWILTTSTGHAGAVMEHMEYVHQMLRPELKVAFTSVSDRWAQFSVAGPNSRQVIAGVLDPGAELADAAFPHMACGVFTALGGVPARVFRISFSGERAYEIAVPAGFGEELVRRMMQAGAPFGLVPYGLESLGTMRVEKGHLGGGEINGQTTARDLGFARLMSSRKDYIGRALAQRPALIDPRRPALVGLRPVDRMARLRSGAHLLPKDAPVRIEHDQGHVTSVAYSPTLGHWIGLGLLEGGPSRHGEVVRAANPLEGFEDLVEVVPPCFLDPQGARLRG